MSTKRSGKLRLHYIIPVHKHSILIACMVLNIQAAKLKIPDVSRFDKF
jgi:hypothetical protein